VREPTRLTRHKEKAQTDCRQSSWRGGNPSCSDHGGAMAVARVREVQFCSAGKSAEPESGP